MGLPEGYLPRRGDTLIVHAVVRFNVREDEDGDKSAHLSPVGAEYSSFMIPLKQIVGVYARKWEEGEKVRMISDHDDGGTIIAVHDDFVWARNPDNLMMTYHANEIEEDVEPPAIVEPPPAPLPVIERAPSFPLAGKNSDPEETV